MSKITFAVKLNESVLDRLKRFCAAHGTKYSFFVEKAIQEKLAAEERREDMLDFKILRHEEETAESFDEYLKGRNV
jgi:predicted transcriptional regulator